MAGGQDYSKHQKGIINRYYEHHDTIVAQRLGEIVSDLYLAVGDKKKTDRLWARVDQALAKSGLDPKRVARVSSGRNVEELARLVGEMATRK